MAKTLGIIGGGQLGMMIAEAAKKMPNEISKIIVLDPTENCPAAQVGTDQIIADFNAAFRILAAEGLYEELIELHDLQVQYPKPRSTP